jgi:putative ABC transport system permease protein
MPLSADIRYAIRVLARSPLFALTAVLSLAVGIAASTAIFSLADAMLFRPRVGITNPESVVDIGRTTGGEGFDNFGYPLFSALRDRNTTLDAISALRFGAEAMGMGDAASAERVDALLVSGNFFEVIGTKAAAGRFFLPEEDRTPGTHPVAVLSHAFWTERFKGDPALVGTTMRLNGLPYTIVGVAEPGFTGTNFLGADFWVPVAMEQHVRSSDASLLADENAVWHTAVGRLKPGVTVEQARQELDAITKTYLKDRGDPRADRWGLTAVVSTRLPAPMRMPVVGFIAVLGTLTGLVLLIACSNVASMLLARALARRREIATRLAVGASRTRIVAQLLIEGLALAVLAAAVSVPATIGVVGILSTLQPELPIPIVLELQVDPRVLIFSLALAGVTTVAFALVPALQSTRFELLPVLHGVNATSDRRRTWLRQSLVAGQVAMALLILVAAGLFLRSLQEAASVDAGFRTENVDLVQLDLRLAGYRRANAVRPTEELIERFKLIPGVTAVATSRMVPLQGGGMGLGGLRVPGYVAPNGRDEIDADWDVVSTDYFRTLDLPIVRGRAFATADREDSTRVAIINERMAELIWPGQDPIGRQILHAYERDRERPLQIVGVAKNSKYRSLSESPRNFIYVPMTQQFMLDVNFYVRRTPGTSQIPAMRQAVRAFNPALPVIYAQTLDSATAIGLLPQRIAAWMAGSVGTVGLFLAALGLYGLTAFSVAQRTREIAVRMALGATRGAVLSLVLRQAARLAAVGGAVGLALATGISMLLQSLLIGIQPIDPAAFGIATVLLAAALLAASFAPARKAAAMDPMRALRAE